MKKLLEKLAKAKAKIQETRLQKDSRNDYSNYNYFSPSYVEKVVQDVCTEFGLYTKFDLVRDEHGEVGILTVFDLDSGENMEWRMASAVPVIKATNATQQLGGAVTYTERYLKMSAFGIVDNSQDFDTTESTKQAKAKPTLSEDRFKTALEKIKSGEVDKLVLSAYQLSENQKKQLNGI